MSKRQPKDHCSHIKDAIAIENKKIMTNLKKEALVIIFRMKNCTCLYMVDDFRLQTVKWQLLTIYGSKKGTAIYKASTLLRWGTILLKYNYTMEYLPSKKLGKTAYPG